MSPGKFIPKPGVEVLCDLVVGCTAAATHVIDGHFACEPHFADAVRAQLLPRPLFSDAMETGASLARRSPRLTPRATPPGPLGQRRVLVLIEHGTADMHDVFGWVNELAAGSCLLIAGWRREEREAARHARRRGLAVEAHANSGAPELALRAAICAAQEVVAFARCTDGRIAVAMAIARALQRGLELRLQPPPATCVTALELTLRPPRGRGGR